MTDTELNVKLAEALGWRVKGRKMFRGPEGDEHIWKPLPNYTGSYDAVMKEVLRLPEDKRLRFASKLAEVKRCGWYQSDKLLFATESELSRALYLTLTQH